MELKPMSTLMQASHQWATRPEDQRFTSLTDLHAFAQHSREFSRDRVVSSRQLNVVPVNKDLTPEVTGRELALIGPNGGAVALNNWSFGQLAQRAGTVNMTDLRKLPAALAADCLNYGLQHYRDVEELKVMLYKNGGAPELRAVNGPAYGRIWNETCTGALVNAFGDGITGDFRVPGEFGKAVEVTKSNTTLYASDRDMFVFLADENHRIEVPNRRNGQNGSMARGIFFWNSEVGAGTLGMASFLFDYVCCNRIVWGAQDYQELRIRHTAGAPDRWIEQAMPAIESFAQHSTSSIEQALKNAQAQKIDKVDEFLRNRFSKSQASAIKAAHMDDEQRPIETIWDAATAVTAYARSMVHQDARVDMEREGGKILQLAQ